MLVPRQWSFAVSLRLIYRAINCLLVVIQAERQKRNSLSVCLYVAVWFRGINELLTAWYTREVVYVYIWARMEVSVGDGNSLGCWFGCQRAYTTSTSEAALETMDVSGTVSSIETSSIDCPDSRFRSRSFRSCSACNLRWSKRLALTIFCFRTDTTAKAPRSRQNTCNLTRRNSSSAAVLLQLS
jgi:hypothetical protein